MQGKIQKKEQETRQRACRNSRKALDKKVCIKICKELGKKLTGKVARN